MALKPSSSCGTGVGGDGVLPVVVKGEKGSLKDSSGGAREMEISGTGEGETMVGGAVENDSDGRPVCKGCDKSTATSTSARSDEERQRRGVPEDPVSGRKRRNTTTDRETREAKPRWDATTVKTRESQPARRPLASPCHFCASRT